MTPDLLKQAVAALVPAAVPNFDYTIVVDVNGNAQILLWNNLLGTQPTLDQLTAAGGGLTLVAAKTAQSSAVEAAYQNATYATAIPYKNTTFWADKDSQLLLMGAVLGYSQLGGTPSGFSWWDSNSVAQPMTLTDLQGLYQAIMIRLSTNFARRKALLTQISSAATIADAQAVNW